MLKGLSDETVPRSSDLCCDNCGDLPVLRLRFFSPIKAKRKNKVKPVRKVSKETIEVMKDRLLSERRDIIHKDGGLTALGGALVCPRACVEEICKRVDYIRELSDISNIPGLRSQFAEKFFNVVKDTLIL